MQRQPQQQRFCWRERTEKLNWRLLRALHLPDVVRRGDPTLLEPYVLHLTFARLPASASTVDSMDATSSLHGRGYAADGNGGGDDQQRNAWFIVRVFQLATEYLLFMRSRDGTVLETMKEELLLCEQECETLAARATKWKERSKSGDKQVQKLHQVLQNIAKLLQLRGATPSAVATIESLLTDMLPRQKGNNQQNQYDGDDDHTQTQRIKEARQCYYCGKMFASAEFLDKHHLRRHLGENRELKVAETHSRKFVPKPQSVQDSAVTSDHPVSGERALRQMLQQVEFALQDHQESLRSLAQQESKKIESLYEQLHVENQLAEQIKASRILAENQVKEAQEQLDNVLQEKGDVLTELNELKEQIQFLDLKRKMEFQVGVTSPVNQSDMTTMLEIKRLEQVLAMVNSALSDSRVELAKLQQLHLTALKDKQALVDQLNESQSYAKRLENTISESSGMKSVSVARKDCGSQTVASEARDTSTQAEAEETESTSEFDGAVLKAEVAAQTHLEMKPATGVEIAIQISPEVEQLRVTPSSVQVPEPVVIERLSVREVALPFSQTTDPAPTSALPVAKHTDDESDAVSDYVYNIVAENLMSAVKSRAQRAVGESSRTSQSPSNKSFSSLPGRKFLRSRYLHAEQAVQKRIANQILKLDQLSQRFGVPPKCNLLSNEHLQIVQQALHGHLEILPTDVLQKMIECEGTVNSSIEKEWVPREKSRQQALELLKVQTQTKSQLNQDLVRQAMTAFSSMSSAGTGDIQKFDRCVEEREEAQVMHQVGIQEPCGKSHSLAPEEPRAPPEYLKSTQEEARNPTSMYDLPVIAEERSLVTEALTDTLIIQTSEDSRARGFRNSPGIEQPSDSPTREDAEPEAVTYFSSVEEVAPVAMKVVTVSPKLSPAKPEPVRTTEEQDLVLESPFVQETGVKMHDLSSLQAAESVNEATAPHATETGIELDDYVHVDLHASQIDDLMTSVGDREDGEEVKIGSGNEEQPRLGAVSPASALSHEEEELEIVDIQSISDATRLPNMQGGVMDSAESVGANQHDRASANYDRGDIRGMSGRSQLHSFRSSELSASMVASSEMSFQASIPSLEESDSNISDLGAPRTDEKVSQVEDSGDDGQPRDSVESVTSEQPRQFQEGSLNAGELDIPDLLSDDDATEHTENEGRSSASIGAPSSQQNSSNTHGPRYGLSATASVLNFSDDDDSEIEEVELG